MQQTFVTVLICYWVCMPLPVSIPLRWMLDFFSQLRNTGVCFLPFTIALLSRRIKRREICSSLDTNWNESSVLFSASLKVKTMASSIACLRLISTKTLVDCKTYFWFGSWQFLGAVLRTLERNNQKLTRLGKSRTVANVLTKAVHSGLTYHGGMDSFMREDVFTFHVCV